MQSDLTGAFEAVRREGITILKSPEGALWDIIFVHGLNGHPRKSWASEKNGFYWPVEVSKKISDARLMTFGYIADLATGNHNHMGIRQHAESLLLNLNNIRLLALKNRPLVFVCHSLGGLVTKEALILDSRKGLENQVLGATKLVVFLGTPHRGSYMLGSKTVYVLEKLAKVAFHEIPSKLKHALKIRSDELFEINEDFTIAKGDIQIVNFYEQKDFKLLGELVVDKDSAVLHYDKVENIPLYRDHRELIRFDSAEDDAYRQVYQTIGRKLSAILKLNSDQTTQDLRVDLSQICLESLGPPGSENRLAEIVEPSEHTFEWLWKRETMFTHWLAHGQGSYWIGGKPGSGKSVLMKEISSGIHNQYMKPNSAIVRHFFNSRGTPLERSFEGFLRSILKQILRQAPALFECTIDRFREEHIQSCWSDDGKSVQWTLRRLKDTLNDIVTKGTYLNAIYVFADALDECEDMSLRGFGIYFQQLCERGKIIDMKICFSTRYIPDGLLNARAESQGFVLQDKNADDIARFVDDRWTSPVLMNEDDENLQTVKNEIIAKADGVFLWVDIVLSKMEIGIEDGNSISELRESLNSIPGQLSGLFSSLLNSIKAEYLSETNTMLSLVLCATRPLTLTEFRYAMAFSRDQGLRSQSTMHSSASFIQTDAAMIKRIRSRCGALVEIKNFDSGTDQPLIVQFIHQSVKDFLLSREPKENSRILDSDKLQAHGHEQLTRACIRYLFIDELRAIPPRLELSYHTDSEDNHRMFAAECPLLDYSVCYWIHHCHAAGSFSSCPFEELDQFFETENTYFDTWWSIVSWIGLCHDWSFTAMFQDSIIRPDSLSHTFESDQTPFQLAVNHSLIGYLRRRIELGECIMAPVETWGSYLMLAVLRGNDEVVELLLENGADPNLRSDSETPLMVACLIGHTSIVAKLLRWGADIYEGSVEDNPVIIAAISGRWDVVKLLHDHDPAFFQNGLCRHMALQHLCIGRLWFKGFYDVDAGDPEFSTEMIILEDRKSDHHKIVNLLTAQGVDYEFFGEAAPWFQWFIISDSETSVEVLTASHANLNIRGAGGVTLLHLACMGGSGDIIRSLVNSSADLNAHTVSGWTMLHAAASNKSEKPLEYLLACGLEPNISDNNMTTPLHLAAANGSDEHLQILLAAGANVSALDSGNCLALHYAMSNWRILNRTKVLDALAKYDVDVSISACDDLSPLHITAKHGSPLLFQWLLNMGANLQAVDHEGRTVLHAAAANDKDMRGVILRTLLDKGMDPNVVDESGMSPLHNVFFWQNGRFEFNLQKEGVTPERRQQTMHTTKEYKTKLQLLLDYGAFINLQDNRGNTVLHWASSSSNGPAVRLLLDRGARKDLMDLEGCKPSDAAKSDKIRLLLDTS